PSVSCNPGAGNGRKRHHCHYRNGPNRGHPVMNPQPQNTRPRDRVRQMLQVTWFRIFVNVGGAALIWGSWAAFVHRDFELHILLKAAFTQAFLSAFLTLMGVTLLEAIFARAPEPLRVPFSALSTFAFV